MSSSSSNYEYHYRHRVTYEREGPVYLPPPPPLPLPALPAPSRVVYVEVEKPPPPPKKRVVFIEIEKPPPPPPRERVVVVKVERPALPWPLRPLYSDVYEMMKSVMPGDSASTTTETKVIRLTANQQAVLEEQFSRWPKWHKGDIVLLAAETGLSEEDVQDWYSLKLSQQRKEQGLGSLAVGPTYPI